MNARTQLAAVLAAVALATAACGAGSDVAGPDTSGDGPVVDDGASDESTAISLGDREAGFGPGSLVADAGNYTLRLFDVRGDWFVQQPYSYAAPPEVCNAGEPVAVQGLFLTRVDPDRGPFGDALLVEVAVMESAEVAAAEVEAFVADSAQACYAATIEQDDDRFQINPGVEMDFTGGFGEEVEPLVSFPEGVVAASRRSSVQASIGSVDQEFQQIETRFAEGRVVVSAAAVTSSDPVEPLGMEMLNALLADPLPEFGEDADLDSAIDAVRSAVLPDTAVPEFFDPNDTLRFRRPTGDSCYGAAPPEVATNGPQWIAVSPGAGASEVRQQALVFSNEDAAVAAFAEYIELGAACYAELVDLPEPDFRLVGSAFETTEIDGITVALAKLDYTQMVGTQAFEVEVGSALVQQGRFAFGVDFFGLAGDSPDLAELAVLSSLQAVE